MSIITTDNQNYINIASAIRAKNNSSTLYYPSQMADAIISIPPPTAWADETAWVQRTISSPYLNDTASIILSYTYAGANRIGATVSFPVCSIIERGAFRGCIYVSSYYFPMCEQLGATVFAQNYRLRTISLPICETIGNGAFNMCSSIISLVLPSVLILENNAFSYCRDLNMISLPACNQIGNFAFASCMNLLSLYLLGSSLCALGGSSVFYSTPISNYTTSTSGVHGSIFVPASLYDSYKAATNWVTYSDRFVSV